MKRPDRVPVHRPAQINLGNGQRITCSIRNLSKDGALLTVHHAGFLPKTFDLEDTFTSETWKAVVVWREPKSVGVRLSGQTPTIVAGKSGFGRRKVPAKSRLAKP